MSSRPSRFGDGVVTWSTRVQGGQVRRRELPAPAWAAINSYLDAAGRPFVELDADLSRFAANPCPLTGNTGASCPAGWGSAT
jgi:hypothetical protein